MKFFLALFILVPTLPGVAAVKFAPGRESILSPEIRRFDLGRYERAGFSITSFLRAQFAKQSNRGDVANFVERLDQAYSDHVQPGDLEIVSVDPLKNRSSVFIEDVNHALLLRQRRADFRTDPKVRLRIQNILIGALHVIDARIRNEMDASVDELLRIRRYLLAQGTFISKGKVGQLNVNDLWWDLLWIRGHGYPLDLVDLHLQKVAVISQEASAQWRERLRQYSISLVLYALRRNTPPTLGREKPQAISLRLTSRAMELTQPTEVALLKEIKLFHYKFLQQNGLTYEAGQLKKEIAMDLFLNKGRQLLALPAERWGRTDLSLPARLGGVLGGLFRGLIVFLTYGAGLIFVATPIELILILTAIVILSRQGAIHFNIDSRSLKSLLKQHRLHARRGWKRLPAFAADFVGLIRAELRMAWRMFVASYTAATPVPFYSKVAVSLLIFGIGLYFNSARLLIEAVVNQMTM